jgi:phytoene dehydrogenase-like protein
LPKTGGRIEGGVDAIVIGASLDGLAAAALLGKAGLKTILLGAGGATLDDERREFAPGFFCVDGEHTVTHLDPELASGLDLYRHGLSFANRRMDSVYYFSDGGALLMEGDLYRTRESVVAMAEADASAFANLVESALDVSRVLRPFFEGDAAPVISEPLASAGEKFLTASVEDVLESAFADEHLKALLAAEASFRSALRPSDPFGFGSLLRRWSGEAAGLQAATAYAEGGAQGLRAALRRAAQAARVDFRPSTGVSRVLVEWDAAAGIETREGGQIRAGVVVSALSARQSFFDLIGPALLDIEFQSALARSKPEFASARVHFALTGEPVDKRTQANLSRRLVFAPNRDEVVRAYGAARRGEVEAPLIMEALFPTMFDRGLAPAKGHVVSAIVHPVPFRSAPDPALSARIAAAARETFERLAPGARGRIIEVDVCLPADEAAASGAPAEVYAASPAVLEEWSRARTLSRSSGIAGYFFCGPEAQIGPGASGAAGRRAAQAAVRYAKARAHA